MYEDSPVNNLKEIRQMLQKEKEQKFMQGITTKPY